MVTYLVRNVILFLYYICMVSGMIRGEKKYLGTIRNFWKFIGATVCYGIVIKLIRVTKLQSDRELI